MRVYVYDIDTYVYDIVTMDSFYTKRKIRLYYLIEQKFLKSPLDKRNPEIVMYNPDTQKNVRRRIDGIWRRSGQIFKIEEDLYRKIFAETSIWLTIRSHGFYFEKPKSLIHLDHIINGMAPLFLEMML